MKLELETSAAVCRIVAWLGLLLLALSLILSCVPPSQAGRTVTKEGADRELESIRIRLIDRDKCEAAIRAIDAVLARDRSDPEPYFYKGLAFHRLAYRANRKYSERGRMHEFFRLALDCYKRAEELGYRTAQFYYHRGEVYLNLGQPARALDDLNKSIKIDPKRGSWIWATRAVAHEDLGNRKQALSDIQQAVTLEPDNVSNLRKLARLLEASKKFDEALHAINKAIVMAPKNPEHYYIRGMIHRDMKNAEAAERDMDRALALDPDHAGALRIRGSIGASGGNLEQAMVDLFESRSIDRTIVEGSEKRASLTSKQARRILEDREARIQRLASKLKSEEMLYDLAFAQWGLGKWKDSECNFEKLWRKARSKRSRTCVYSACLRSLACLHLKNPAGARQALDASTHCGNSGLPAQVLSYLSDAISQETLLKAASGPETRTIARFYIAARLRASGQPREARGHLEWICFEGSRSCDEYLLAVMELSRLGAGNLDRSDKHRQNGLSR